MIQRQTISGRRHSVTAAIGLAVTAALWCPPTAAAQSDSELTRRSDYRQALRALSDKLPEVAAARLEKILASGSVKGAAAGTLKLLLAECLVRAGKAARALEICDAPDVRALPESALWRGAALAGLRRWTEAEAVLAAVPATARHAEEAAFTRAAALAALREPTRAAALLKPFFESKDKEMAARARLWCAEFFLSAEQPGEATAVLAALTNPPARLAGALNYLRARAALASGRAAAAVPVFRTLSEGGRGIARSMQHAATLGLSRALRAEGQSAEALSVLEQLIGDSPAPALSILQPAFADFEELNRTPGAEAESFLNTWSSDENRDLQVLARLAHVAALEQAGRVSDAMAACRAATQAAADSPLLAQALLRQARLSLLSGERAAASEALAQLKPLAVSPALRAWTAWLEAQVQLADGKFAQAAQEFAKAARESTSPAAQIAAAYSAALAELRGDVSASPGALALLDSIGTPEARAAGADFHLERALYLASTRRDGAREALLAFVEAMPDHPRRFEALAALAELALASPAPPPAAAAGPNEIQTRLAALTATARSPAQHETAAWLVLQAAERTGDTAAYAKDAAAFIERWPQSSRRAAVRMKLAEIFFRRQNFSGARQQFEQLARDEPLHPLAAAALFWAGKAAFLSLGQSAEKDAIMLWEEVYRRDGPFKLEARFQEALLNQRRGDHVAALQLLKDVLEHKPAPDAVMRWQVLCARGEVLTAQNAGPEQVKAGLASFDEVAADPTVTAAWRQQALVRKGACLELLKRPEEAIEVYHAVLSELPPAESTEDRDDYWFHRAGGKALQMLESAGKGESAVRIAQKMSRAPGPRGRAAAGMMNQLALKYGVWLEKE